MTLTEYLNQTEPARYPDVILKSGEYKQGQFAGSYGNKTAWLQINGLPFTYAVKEGDPAVYTTDEDGNPKSKSCFHIPQNFKPSAQLLEAAGLLLAARAYTETIRPTVEAYKAEVFQRLQLPIADEYTKGRRAEPFRIITNPEEMYLISDEHWPLIVDELHKQHIANGFQVEHGYCPLLIAEDMERKARAAVLDAAEYITGYPADRIYNLERRAKMIELILTLCAPFINSEEVLTSLNA